MWGAEGQLKEVFLRTAPPCSQLTQDRALGVLLRVTLMSFLFPTHYTLCWVTKSVPTASTTRSILIFTIS